MPLPHKILPFIDPVEAELVDDPAALDAEILANLSERPPGGGFDTPTFGWEFARASGLLWREDARRWERRLIKEGRIMAEHPTEREVVQLATLFIAKLLDKIRLHGRSVPLPAPYRGPDGVPRYARAIIAQAKIFSEAGRPGENRCEEFVRTWVVDYLEDGVAHRRVVPRHCSVTSELLLRLYRYTNRDGPVVDRKVQAELVAAMGVVFPKCPQCHCIKAPSGKPRRGWKGVALKTRPPDSFSLDDYQDGLGRF
jgi:hypothetical protein